MKNNGSLTKNVPRPFAIVRQMTILARFTDEANAVRALRARRWAGQSCELVLLTRDEDEVAT